MKKAHRFTLRASKVIVTAAALVAMLLGFQNCSKLLTDSPTQVEPATNALPPNADGSATYTWVGTQWGSCSILCGGGTQTRTVNCTKSDATVVADSFCTTPKPQASQACNIQVCAPYMWIQGGFGPCSVSCGGGTQTQTVVCENSQAQTVANSFCSGTQPLTSQACNTQSCPSACTPGTQRSCQIGNGVGSQTCNSSGSAWGACGSLTSCNTGYALKNGACVTPSVTTNSLAQLPYMGFSTYYSTRKQHWQPNNPNLKQVADDMKNYGLVSSGYNLFNVDIGWWFAWTGSPRDPNSHKIIPGPTMSAQPKSTSVNPITTDGKNPTLTNYNYDATLSASDQDMASLIDYFHADGLHVGLYTDSGSGDSSGCGGFPGSGGYIQQDLIQMTKWGVDMIKVDHCGGSPNAKAAGVSTAYNNSDYEYGLWSSAIMSAANVTGKQLLFNSADWVFGDRTQGWEPGIANSWRTQSDIDYSVYNTVNGQYVLDTTTSQPVSWSLILRNFTGNDVPPAAGPGHWNDPDYLMIGGYGLSATEEQSYFNMWVIQAAPLMLATYPGDLSPNAPDGPRLRAMLLNPEVIAIDQDSLGRQGEKVREDIYGQVVYSKALSGTGQRAVLILNKNDTPASSITVHWGDLGLASGSATIRDLVARQDLGSYISSYTALNIPAHSSQLLLVKGTEAEVTQGSWQTQSIRIIGNPAVAINGSVEADVALGLDRYYWMRTKSGSTTSTWARIKPSGCSGDVIFFGAPAVTYADGALNLVGLGYVDGWGYGPANVSTYSSYSFDNGKTWACFGDLGKPSGGLNGQLAMTSPDGIKVDIFGRSSDNTIWYTEWTSSGGWSTWQSEGTACTHSGISASSRGNGSGDIAVIGCDDKVWHAWYTSAGQLNWDQIPSQSSFSNTPASVWNSSAGTYSVFATSTSGRDVQISTWSNPSGWSSWSSLGGCLKAGVSASESTPISLIGTACNTPGTNADTDGIGDRPVTLSH